jgi:hypothetical protein
LLFSHRLEQRGLRLRHGAVDLVDEDDVGKDRPRPEFEVPLPLVEDGEPGDVGGLQVRRALDARRRRPRDRLGDRTRQHGLGRSGNVLEQHVSAADHGGEDELDLVALAVDHGLDVFQEAIRRRGRALEQVRPL